jgi:hypothetical protein
MMVNVNLPQWGGRAGSPAGSAGRGNTGESPQKFPARRGRSFGSLQVQYDALLQYETLN